MRQPHVLLTLAALAMLIPSATRADHIPGHSDDDPTFPMPLPGQDFFNGGGAVTFLTLIGPDEGTEIYNTTFDITYVSDGVTPASDLYLSMSMTLDTGFVDIVVLGSDLGFGSGPGTFVGTFETDAFNGIAQGGFFPFATIGLTIDAIGGGVQGQAHFEDSFIIFDVEASCDADTNMSGTVDVDDLINVILDFGTNGAVHRADIDDSGLVDVDDLIEVILGWGSCG